MSWKLGKSTAIQFGLETNCFQLTSSFVSSVTELKESSFLGGGHHHSSHKDSTATITPAESRSTTPTPGSHGHVNVHSAGPQRGGASGTSSPAPPPPTARSGLLKIRVSSGKGLKLPDGGKFAILRMIRKNLAQ